MTPTRREFIKSLGAALASLAAASCAASESDDRSSDLRPTCYKPMPSTPEPTPSATPTPTPSLEQQAAILTAVAEGDDIDPEVARRALGAVERDRLRSYWLGFNRLAEETQGNPEGSEQALAQLVANHWSTLNVVLDAGGLVVEDKTTAFRMQITFCAVAYYTWCSSAPVLCSPLPEVEDAFIYIEPLRQQIDRLVKMAASGDIAPSTVEDNRWITYPHIYVLVSDKDAVIWSLCDELVDLAKVGVDFPSLDTRSVIGWDKEAYGHEADDIIVDLILEVLA